MSSPDSTTETYAALKLTIDNWRWAGVPFYLRTGKALGVKRTEVAIKFKQAPFAMFRDTPVDRLSQNYLVIGIEPTEGIALQFNTKVPGPTIAIDGVEMKFRYKDYFKAEPSTGYETLIYDCMIGDNILFQRADSVEAGWQAVQPFLDAWKKAGADGLQDLQGRQRGPGLRPTNCWRATAAAGESSADNGDEATTRRIIVVADAGGAGDGRRRTGDGPDRRQCGRVAICLTGGSSPKQLYQLLATEPIESRIPWDRVHWFIGDERFVPADDPLNNMAMARETFLDRCAPPANIHPIATDDAPIPIEAASALRARTEVVLRRRRLDPARPLFDLVLMGVGPDGHTASLFPGYPALDETERWVVGVPKANVEPFVPRVTLTLPALASCREMLFEVAGAEKRAILTRLLRRRGPAGQPRAIQRRDRLAGRPRRASGEFSWAE